METAHVIKFNHHTVSCLKKHDDDDDDYVRERKLIRFMFINRENLESSSSFIVAISFV